MRRGLPAGGTKTPGKRRTFFCLLVIAGMIASAFLPALDNGFTNWDDDAYVTGNPDIKGFTSKNLLKVCSSSYVGNYQPVTMLAYMTAHALSGLRPMAYHGTSVVLHCVNGLLVFAFVLSLSGNRATALLAALFFAVHPLRVESVAWVAELKDVLSALFYLVSLLAYLRYLRKGGKKNYTLSLAAQVLSLLSKPMAVSLPFVLILIDYIRSRKIDKKTLFEKWPFFAAAAVMAVITVVTQKNAGQVAECHTLPFAFRLCVPFYGVLFYCVKTAAPFKLCSYYSFPAALSAGAMAMFAAAPFLAAGGAAAVAWVSARERRRPAVAGFLFGNHRNLVFGSLFYLITLLPVLQIVPIGGAIVAERYAYFPMIGMGFLLAEACRFLLDVKFRNSRLARSFFWAAAGMAVCLMVFMTRERCRVWNSSISLWSDVISKYPTSVAYTNRGAAYNTQGNYEQAIENYTQAIRLDPEYAQEYGNRGLAYKSLGDYTRAIEDYTRAIAIDPKYALAYCNRGVALKAKGEIGLALEDYNRAIALNPDYAQAYNNRGVAENALGGQDRAVEDFTKAIALNPDYAQAYNNRGVAYCMKGEYRRGIDDYTKAVALKPEYSDAYYNRGQAWRAAGDRRQALDDMRKACAGGNQAACRELAPR